MLLLVLLTLAACAPKDDSGAAPSPDETGDTAQPRDCAPAEEDPEPTREGHPSDGWRWTKQGALFDDAEAFGYNEGDLAPSVVDTGSGLHLLFTRKSGVEMALWASSSPDGVSWAPPVPVTGLEEGSGEYPSLLHEQGAFRLFYGSGTIDEAVSSDGVAFEPLGGALSPGQGQLSLLYPGIVRDGAVLELYYTAFDGVSFSIQRVSSEDDGASWGEAALVLDRDPDGWDNSSVAMPMAVQNGGERLLWYGGYDTSQTDPGPWRIGSLGPDGQRRVSLPLAEAGPDAWSTRDPAVIRHGDGWLMIYTGMGDDGVYRLMSATSDVCG
jgi:hypothetical protein